MEADKRTKEKGLFQIKNLTLYPHKIALSQKFQEK